MGTVYLFPDSPPQLLLKAVAVGAGLWAEQSLRWPLAVTEGASVSGKQKRGIFPSLPLRDHLQPLPLHRLLTASKSHNATGFPSRSYQVSMNLPSFDCSCGRSQECVLSFHRLR